MIGRPATVYDAATRSFRDGEAFELRAWLAATREFAERTRSERIAEAGRCVPIRASRLNSDYHRRPPHRSNADADRRRGRVARRPRPAA